MGPVTSVHLQMSRRLATEAEAGQWQFDPDISGGGLLFDIGSHGLDLLDFFFGPIAHVEAFALNTGHRYRAEDVTVASLRFASALAGTATFNFHAFERVDRLTITGANGELSTPVFDDEDVVMRTAAGTERHSPARPPHVHQPLIQTIVDELHGRGRCESTGESSARTSWVMDRCLDRYDARRPS
jgi:predicted dehydrogenase